MKTPKGWRGRVPRVWLLLGLVAGSYSGCSKVTDAPSSSGETHFLRHCNASCAGGFACVCGACTQSCETSADCSSLAPSAICVSRDGLCEEAQGDACDLRCTVDADCRSLGDQHVCEDGVCRAPAPMPLDATTADASPSEAGTADGSGVTQCGTATCPPGQRCCDHCLGSCVSENAELLCPDDRIPLPSCQDAATSCAMSGQSCLSSSCCDGLECCSGVPLPDGAALCYSVCPISDRNAKTDIAPIDESDILQRVLQLPLHKWRYKNEAPGVAHIGPMAQDFMAQFGVGVDDRHIFPLDEGGIAFAAIQGLHRRLSELAREHTALREQNEALRRELEALKARRRSR